MQMVGSFPWIIYDLPIDRSPVYIYTILFQFVISSPYCSGNYGLQRKSGRKPLQPIKPQANLLAATTDKCTVKPCSKLGFGEISLVNKENLSVPAKIESIDASLGEELSAIREKLERLRLDKEKTEKMLMDRDAVLDIQMKELYGRGEEQKILEMEVDRLFRLKELRSSCMRMSSVRPLRETSQENKQQPSLELKDGEEYESTLPSPRLDTEIDSEE